MTTDMAEIAIFRINYKSDFILTLQSDAGWMTPFCIKFWTGAPSQAYYVGYDGSTYNHCAPDPEDPTKLRVQFDDHGLPIGDLKFQIGYHFTVADFPTSVEDEVLNQASVIIEVDGAPAQVMLDFNGETAPEIAFSLPAYANEAQRIANEEQRIAAESQRISNEEARITAEQARQQNEQQRINNEALRVQEFALLKAESQEATSAANAAAALAAAKAQLAADKAALAQAAATLANDKAQLAADKAALAQAASELCDEKAALAQQKAAYAQQQGNYSKAQGDYAKEQGDYSKAQGDIAHADHQRAETDHTTAAADHATAVEDHRTAGFDHTLSNADHILAGQDHTTAAADHETAASDHTIAASDHETAAADHETAASDHTRAESDHETAAADHTRAVSDHETYEETVGKNTSDIAFINKSFGKYDGETQLTLSQAKSGKYVNVNGGETSASGYGISNPVALNAGDILLVPSAQAVPATVSVIARLVDRTYQKVIAYIYTYRTDYPELPATATADYDSSLVYTAVYDESGDTPVLTGWTRGGETYATLPATREVNEQFYEPLMKQAVAAMPNTGYYIYLCPTAMTVVVSGLTATVSGGIALVVGWGIFKNITTNFVGAPGQSVLAQAFAVLFAAIDGMKAQLENLGETKAVTIDFENSPKLCGQDMFITGDGAPASPVVPSMVGQEYLDKTNNKCYKAFRVTGAISDWVLLN